MKTETKPKWVLTDDYGISIDSLNWKLLKRSYSKDGLPTKWKTVGYFPTLEMLAGSLTRRVMLEDTEATDIVSHLIHAVQSVEGLLSALKVQMNTMDGIGLQTRPAGYRKYAA